MKILVDGMPRGKGGIGSLLLNFAVYSKQLPPEKSIEFNFLISKHSAYQSDLERLGCKYFVVPSITSVRDYSNAIKGIFRENKYDFLWLNNTSKVNRILPVYAAKEGAKLITHPHGVGDEEQGIKKKLFNILNKLNHSTYMRLVKLPLACSVEAARCYYRGAKDIFEKSLVIKNGIFVDRFAYSEENRNSIRSQLQLKDGDVVLGTVGRLTAVKNYMFILSLLENLPSNYRCIILGEGEDREKLEQSAEEKGLKDRFLLLGQKENVNEYLSAFDIFVLPSLHEGMPYAVIEAQASGLPCLVSDTVSSEVRLTDLVNFAELNNVQAWMDKILEIQLCDENRAVYANEISEKGYSIEKSYDIFFNAVSKL